MPNVLLFGGCNLRGPFMRMKKVDRRIPSAAEAWSKVPDDVTFSGVPFMTYTVGEMVQAVELYHGRRYIPTEIRKLAGISPNFLPHPRIGFNNVDVLLIEPNTSLEIEFDGWFLNRNRVMEFLETIRQLSPEANKLAGRWYQKGISASNDELKNSLAEAIIELLPMNYPDLHFTTVLLRRARGVKAPMRPGLQKLIDSTDVPIGLVTYTWRYMPDGRPISWPADFGKDVRASAKELNLPLLEMSDLVEAYGIVRALRPDLRHYSEEFQPIAARAFVEFAKEIAAGRVRDGVREDVSPLSAVA